MALIRRVELADLLELRERVLTPGHPGRLVVWPYDVMAIHYAMFIDEALVGCASVTRQEMPDRTAHRAHHLHSMAMEPDYQHQGLGRQMLQLLAEEVRETDADLLWATARPSAVAFYRRCGFEVGSAVRVKPTNALMYYVWLTL